MSKIIRMHDEDVLVLQCTSCKNFKASAKSRIDGKVHCDACWRALGNPI